MFRSAKQAPAEFLRSEERPEVAGHDKEPGGHLVSPWHQSPQHHVGHSWPRLFAAEQRTGWVFVGRR